MRHFLVAAMFALGLGVALAQEAQPSLSEATRLKAELFKAQVEITQLRAQLAQCQTQVSTSALQAAQPEIEALLKKELGDGEIDWATLTVKKKQ